MDVVGNVAPPEQRMQIIEIGDPQLKKASKPAEKFNDNLGDLLDKMANTMYHYRGVGLAAPQVGINKKIVVVDYGEGLTELINPRILSEDGEEVAFEGCLSVPGYLGEVSRPTELRIVGQNRNGEKFWMDLEGWPARIVRHEIDHLDGNLFVDRSERVVKMGPETQLRVVFMGTPEFSCTPLASLIDNNCQVVGVVTAPDKPRGRGQKMQPTPVKEMAMNARIPVIAPENAHDEEFVKYLRWLEPDLIVTVAYGQILRQDILGIPDEGAINVHPSLLPKYRGAAPLQRQIMNGETETGVTIFFMTQGMDDGPILMQEKTELSSDETAGDLHNRLAGLSSELLIEALSKIGQGDVDTEEQDHSRATYAPKIKKSELEIDWSEKCTDIVNKIRALSPKPGARTEYKDRGKVKILDAVTKTTVESVDGIGEILRIDENGILVSTGEGCCLLQEIQPPGSKAMNALDFVNGYDVQPGDKFGGREGC